MKPEAIAKRSRDVVLEQWHELLRFRREVLKTSDIETIHDLRVASRRFRAVLGLFGPWIPHKNAALLKKAIRHLTQELGGLRNIDEALVFFRLHTPAESAGGYQLRYMLTQMRGGELVRMRETLAAFDRHRLSRMVRKAAFRIEADRTTAGRLVAPAYFSDICSQLFQPIRELLPAATLREHSESRHALRIAIKKWRYFFEIAAPLLGYDAGPIQGYLKEYQTILGRMNDVAAFGALCSSLELSRHERLFIETTLQTENEHLLKDLTELITRKPLACPSLL